MKFAYKDIELPPGGRREVLFKPIIPVYLFHKKSFVRYEALIDSGADFCIFHKEIADILGIHWKKGAPHTFVGITGAKGYVYFHEVKVKVGKWTEAIVCGFSNDVSEENYGILGQDFFEKFKVTFDLSTLLIDIRRK